MSVFRSIHVSANDVADSLQCVAETLTRYCRAAVPWFKKKNKKWDEWETGIFLLALWTIPHKQGLRVIHCSKDTVFYLVVNVSLNKWGLNRTPQSGWVLTTAEQSRLSPSLTLDFDFSPHSIPQGHPSAPALSALSHASDLDWWSISHVVMYMFPCNSVHLPHPFLPALCP